MCVHKYDFISNHSVGTNLQLQHFSYSLIISYNHTVYILYATARCIFSFTTYSVLLLDSGTQWVSQWVHLRLEHCRGSILDCYSDIVFAQTIILTWYAPIIIVASCSAVAAAWHNTAWPRPLFNVAHRSQHMQDTCFVHMTWPVLYIQIMARA